MQRPTTQTFLIILAAAIVFTGTFVIVMAGIPENVSLRSDDGVMRVRVASRRDVQPTLSTEHEPSLTAPLFGARYHIDGLPVTDVPAEISVAMQPGTPSGVVLYARHPSLPLWGVVPDVRRVSGALSARVMTLTEYALGVVENVAAPEFASDMDALIAQAPEKTVAYRIVMSYRRAGEGTTAPHIILPARLREGACGTAVPWEGTEIAERERTARVDVDGTPTDLIFTLTAFYFTHPDGCPPDTRLTARD